MGTHHATTAVSGLLIKFKQYEMDPNQTPSYFKKDTPPSSNLEHVTYRSRFSVRLTQTLPAKNFSKFYFKRLSLLKRDITTDHKAAKVTVH